VPRARAQIYNERVYDLLRDPYKSSALAVHGDGGAGATVEGLSEFVVTCVSDTLALVATANRNRAVRTTVFNEASSRSHTVMTLAVEQAVSGTSADAVTRSRLHLVDLAGSERWDVARGPSLEDAHVRELTSINKSLHTLAKCVTALAAGARHIPVRDSKLTMLLRDSLGGNAKVRIIATLTPAAQHVNETVATLKFADSARRVMTHARAANAYVPDRVMVRQLQAEVRRMREAMMASGSSAAGGGGPDPRVGALEKELAASRAAVAALTRALADANEELARRGAAAREAPAAVVAAAAAAAAASAGGGGGGGGGGVEAEEHARVAALGAAHERAATAFRNLAGAFFDLDIEEDALRSGVDATWAELRRAVDQIGKESGARARAGKAAAGARAGAAGAGAGGASAEAPAVQRTMSPIMAAASAGAAGTTTTLPAIAVARPAASATGGGGGADAAAAARRAGADFGASGARGGGGGGAAVAGDALTPRGGELGAPPPLFARAGAPGGRPAPPARATLIQTPLSDSALDRRAPSAMRSGGVSGGARATGDGLNGMAFRVQGRTGGAGEQQVVRAVSPDTKVRAGPPSLARRARCPLWRGAHARLCVRRACVRAQMR
jgi:hypothetical protein